jgi:hypothetical protein
MNCGRADCKCKESTTSTGTAKVEYQDSSAQLQAKYDELLEAHTKIQRDSNVTLEKYRTYKAFFGAYQDLRWEGHASHASIVGSRTGEEGLLGAFRLAHQKCLDISGE